MKLLIDIGNTRIKWCFSEAQQLTAQQAFNWQLDFLTHLFSEAWNNINPPTEIWVSNVSGNTMANKLTQWTQKQWQLTPFFAQTHYQCCNVTNGYQKPQQLGIDRWLAVIAARYLCSDAACIADCGTAITIDALQSNGQHLGGLITLGLSTTRSTLLKKTHALTHLSDINSSNPDIFLGKETTQAIMQGTLVSVLSLLEYTVKYLERNEESVILFITGGDALQLIPLLSINYQYEPNLVLQGLHIVAEHS